MSQEGPQQHVDFILPEDYSYRALVPPLIYKATTRLPLEEVLSQIDNLRPSIRTVLNDCFLEIYSPVALRKPAEGTWHFCHTTSRTMFLELENDVKVKDKDHVKKGASTYHITKNTIEAIDRQIADPTLPQHHVPLLNLFKSILIVHQNGLIKALKEAADPEHFSKHQNLDVTKLEVIQLSPEEEQEVEKAYPSTPSPKKTKTKTKTTPQKLSEHDKKSLARLKPPAAKKKLFADEEEDMPVHSLGGDDEDDEFKSDEARFSSRFGEFFDSFSSDKDDENFSDEADSALAAQIDAMMFSPMLTITSPPAPSSKNPPKASLQLFKK